MIRGRIVVWRDLELKSLTTPMMVPFLSSLEVIKKKPDPKHRIYLLSMPYPHS